MTASNPPYPQEFYPGCPCYRCDSPTWREIVPGIPEARMSLCPQCGNKRCPGAKDHENMCSGSNEPGQPGSLYADVRPVTASNEPRVSDEDREAAIAMILRQRCIFEDPERAVAPSTAEAHLMTDAYIGHGWGPKPRVDPTKLGEFIDAANQGGMAVPWRALQDYLRECGIEVTDGD